MNAKREPRVSVQGANARIHGVVTNAIAVAICYT